MFRYPDFFKVGISESGNHDNREYEDDWGERYQGLLAKNPDGTTNYDEQANQNLAKNLKGHLLLVHGTMDDNVPPYNTLLVVNELIKANKDFDLLLMPNRHHGYATEPYMIRRRWDYFVRYLMGAEPPREFEFKVPGVGRPGGALSSSKGENWATRAPRTNGPGIINTTASPPAAHVPVCAGRAVAVGNEKVGPMPQMMRRGLADVKNNSC